MDEQEELIEKAKKGDPLAFEKLIIIHQKRLYNFAYHLVKNHQDAQDIVQQALIKAFLSIRSFKGKSSFTTWIYRILINTFQDELRRSYRKHEIPDDLSLSSVKEIDVSNIVDENEIRNQVRKAVDELPQDLRMLILLRDLQGFKYNEIAEIMKIPVGTVKSRISKTREMLRKILK